MGDLSSTLGSRLRELRLERGLGLRETARRAGISHGLLSQVETGRTNPSVATLARISTVLGVPVFDDVVRAETSTATLAERVVRRERRRALAAYSPARDWLLTPTTDGAFAAFYTTVAPRSDSGGTYTHLGGQEFLYIISGRLELTVETETWTLGEGDTVTFRASQEHGWRNLGSEPVNVIWIVANASERSEGRT